MRKDVTITMSNEPWQPHVEKLPDKLMQFQTGIVYKVRNYETKDNIPVLWFAHTDPSEDEIGIDTDTLAMCVGMKTFGRYNYAEFVCDKNGESVKFVVLDKESMYRWVRPIAWITEFDV